MDRPVVTVSDGKLRGTTLKSVLGKSYLAFKGIPYAQPPIGHLRFKEPQAPAKWTGIRDASASAGDMPTQFETVGERPFEVIGGEDCLYLNVFANSIGSKRPVLFYVYGGKFIEGSGSELYQEDYFVNTDAVLVYVTYRLGPMGFLNVGHEAAPGNQGVRDVILALKWVQTNIEAFGGDPNNVTIFGNSAGAILCHLFTLIPATKGLFHKAILQSGTVLMLRNLTRESKFTNGFKLASLLGFESDDPVKVVEFLRTVPAKKLVGLEGQLLSKRDKMVLGLLEYAPVYDAEYTKDPLIPVPIGKLLYNPSHVPIIIGYTKDEILLGFCGKYNDDEHFGFYASNFEEIMKNSLRLQDPSRLPEIMEDIRKFYLKDKPISRENAGDLIALLTDIYICNTRKIVDLRNETGSAPTYMYRFSYVGDEPTFYQYDEGPQPLKGAAHADELSYMFYFSYMKMDREKDEDKCPQEGSTDRNVIERFVRMWYNFAATGNPTPEIDDRYVTTIWKPTTKDDMYYLDMGENLALERDEDSGSRWLYERTIKNAKF